MLGSEGGIKPTAFLPTWSSSIVTGLRIEGFLEFLDGDRVEGGGLRVEG